MNTIEIIDIFYPILDEEPFSSFEDMKRHWLLFVDLLCLLLKDEMENDLPTQMSRVGMGYMDGASDMVLSPSGIGTDLSLVYSPELKDLFDLLIKKGEGSFSLSKLFDHLSDTEILAVLLCYAGQTNRRYEQLFAELYCKSEKDISAPTVGLCMDMARFFLSEADPAPLLAPDSYINSFIFELPGDPYRAEGMSRELVIKAPVMSFIEDSSPVLFALKPYARIMLPSDDDATICLTEVYDELKKALLKSRVIEICGEEGSGRRFLLSKASGEKSIILVDMKLFYENMSDDIFEDCITELVFLGSACGCIPYLMCQDDAMFHERALRRFFTGLFDRVPVFCIGTQKPISDDILGGCADAIFRINVPEMTAHHQKTLWKEATKSNGLSFKKGYSLDVLVSKYVMSPGRIYEVAKNVAAANPKSVIDEKILEEQIRRSCSVQFGENATRLSSPFTWEDMMISPESEKLLRMAADRVRYRSTVNEDFGFNKKLPYGRGVAIVFYGPPGTGKTMAAQVLANDLGLDIYRIDLSQVSSKYIGETEKNLGVVFDAAKNSNAILFFDEADSLFSKRTEVSSSNDKYANAETSYLLQKIEEYSGVSVLATNNMQNFDAAFKRRMTFIIPIEAPDEDTRVRLWEAVFPADAPLSAEVDVRILAHVAELTGSSIKSAAVSAAYMAAAAGRKITWEDLVTAVELEGTKAGTLGLGNRLREAILTGID